MTNSRKIRLFLNIHTHIYKKKRILQENTRYLGVLRENENYFPLNKIMHPACFSFFFYSLVTIASPKESLGDARVALLYIFPTRKLHFSSFVFPHPSSGPLLYLEKSTTYLFLHIHLPFIAHLDPFQWLLVFIEEVGCLLQTSCFSIYLGKRLMPIFLCIFSSFQLIISRCINARLLHLISHLFM